MVATGNLAIAGLAFLLGGAALRGLAEPVFLVVSFPGCLWLMACATSYPDAILAVAHCSIILVLNAYLWGCVFGNLISKRHHKHQEAEDPTRCFQRTRLKPRC